MNLIQILLPVYDNDGNTFTKEFYTPIVQELTDLFGGITTYTRTPATGLWKENNSNIVKDDIIVYEVMADKIDTQWWKKYKEQLRNKFTQDELIVRCSTIELL